MDESFIGSASSCPLMPSPPPVQPCTALRLSPCDLLHHPPGIPSTILLDAPGLFLFPSPVFPSSTQPLPPLFPRPPPSSCTTQPHLPPPLLSSLSTRAVCCGSGQLWLFLHIQVLHHTSVSRYEAVCIPLSIYSKKRRSLPLNNHIIVIGFPVITHEASVVILPSSPHPPPPRCPIATVALTLARRTTMCVRFCALKLVFVTIVY